MASFSWLTAGGPSEGAVAGAPPGASVNILGRQRIGRFDVTRLAAQDPAALANWLTDNDFPQPDGIDADLAPYVAAHGRLSPRIALLPQYFSTEYLCGGHHFDVLELVSGKGLKTGLQQIFEALTPAVGLSGANRRRRGSSTSSVHQGN